MKIQVKTKQADDSERFEGKTKIVKIIKNDSDGKKEAKAKEIHRNLYQRFKSKCFKDCKEKIETFFGHFS